MRNALKTFRHQTKESVGVLSDLSDRNLMKLGIGFTYVMNGMSDVASSPLLLLLVYVELLALPYMLYTWTMFVCVL